MATLSSRHDSQARNLAQVEEQLARTLVQTAEELQHIDDLDDEQRAEIYTILRIMREDNAGHRALIGKWVSDRGAGDA